MTLEDLFELSLTVALIVLALMMILGAVRFRPSKFRGSPWSKRLRKFGRYTVVRLPIAIGFGLAVFVLGAAGLTLNSHRPPGDNSPIVTLPDQRGEATIELSLDSCEGGVQGSVATSGKALGKPGPAKVYSDQDGTTRLTLEETPERGDRRGGFELSDPLARRGLLSCYLQLPVLNGARGGYTVRLNLGEDMEVDTEASVPAPEAYNRGKWSWPCPPGEACAGFVAINYSIEDGTKQVIVLVLASVFGALIALLVGEVLIEWSRRRFRKNLDSD